MKCNSSSGWQGDKYDIIIAPLDGPWTDGWMAPHKKWSTLCARGLLCAQSRRVNLLLATTTGLEINK